MKVTKQQLRHFIQEAHSLSISPEKAEDIFAMISEMGFRLYDASNNTLPTWMDENSLAVDDAMQAYPGEFTYNEVEAAVKFVKDAGFLEPSAIREGSRDAKSTLYTEVPSIHLIGDAEWGGEGLEVMTLSPTDADTLEGLVAQCYDVTDEMLLKLDIGESRANATSRVQIDPQFLKVRQDLENALESLYTVQMGLSHLRDGSGS